MGDFVVMLPSSIRTAIGELRRSSSKYINWSTRVRAVSTAGMPADLAAVVQSQLSTASAMAHRNGVALGGKADALQKRLDAFLRAEALANANQVFGGFDDFENFLRQRGLNAATLSVTARVDLWAEFLQVGRYSAASAGGRVALAALVSEVTEFDTKLSIKYTTAYERAVASIMQRKGGTVTAAAVHAEIERLHELEIRAKVKVPSVPGWIGRAKLMPIAGALFDGYIGYQQSSASSTGGRLETAITNAATNVGIDAIPVAGQTYGLWDLFAMGSDYQPSNVVLVESDAATMVGDDDRKGLGLQYDRIMAGEYGALPKKMLSGMSRDEYIRRRMRAASGR